MYCSLQCSKSPFSRIPSDPRERAETINKISKRNRERNELQESVWPAQPARGVRNKPWLQPRRCGGHRRALALHHASIVCPWHTRAAPKPELQLTQACLPAPPASLCAPGWSHSPAASPSCRAAATRSQMCTGTSPGPLLEGLCRCCQEERRQLLDAAEGKKERRHQPLGTSTSRRDAASPAAVPGAVVQLPPAVGKAPHTSQAAGTYGKPAVTSPWGSARKSWRAGPTKQLPLAAHVSLNIYCMCLALMRICNLSVASVYLGGCA